MANLQYKNQKKPLVFTKGEINRAASNIRHGVVGDERLKAIKVIQNFREYHLYPLMLLKNHLVRTSTKVSGKTNVARRLKRLATIVNKLERPTLDGNDANSIKLTRMQDIAGCRAIVKDLKKLKSLQVKLENSKSVHKIIRTKEYLEPKDSGYGGIHLVYSCYEGLDGEHEWKKAKVEVQLRTELQHAWATSLEIIDTLEQINLKTSHDGHAEWREFFSIAGNLVAHKETACIIEDKIKLNNFRKRLLELSTKLDVITKIARYTIAINFATDNKTPKFNTRSQGMFLVKMYHPENGKVKVSLEFFRMKETDIALSHLNEADLDESIAVSILVSASDVRALKQAYPNYFGSTKQFINFVEGQCALVQYA